MDDLRQQERALMRGILICLLAFAAGMGLWAYNYVYGHRPSHLPAPPQPLSKPIALAQPAPVPAPVPPVIATMPGPRYVHRAGGGQGDGWQHQGLDAGQCTRGGATSPMSFLARIAQADSGLDLSTRFP